MIDCTDTDASILILAGGESRRMDRDKAFIAPHGRDFLDLLLSDGARYGREVVVVANDRERYGEAMRSYGWAPVGDDHVCGRTFARRGSAILRLVSDLRPGEGPLAGIEAGLRTSTSPLCFVTGCDRPGLSEHLVATVLGRLRATVSEAGDDEALAAVPFREGSPRPLSAGYTRAVRRTASRALDAGERSLVEGLLPRVEVHRLEMDAAPERWFMNLNRPEDLERAR